MRTIYFKTMKEARKFAKQFKKKYGYVPTIFSMRPMYWIIKPIGLERL